jgi:hypothetical protein
VKSTDVSSNNTNMSTGGADSNKNVDVLSSFENLITIMTNQTKIHADLLKNVSGMERK